jgi:superfamily II DNA or RNA helicase
MVVKAMQSIEILAPRVYFIDTRYVFASSATNIDRQKPRFLKQLITDPARNALIVQNAVKAALSGRHVLILTERVDHVETLYSALVKELIPRNITVGMMTGATPKGLREKHQAAHVLVATSQLLATGFNRPELDTLIFATPIQSVKQACGRILRRHPGKKDPIVIDLVDSGSKMALVLGKSRRKKYLAENWAIFGDAPLRAR